MIRLALLLALLAPPALAQADSQAPGCPFVGQSPMLVVQLFFGQSRAGAEPISRRAWERFVADTVTPALPDGFTITAGTGQFIDPATRVIGREQTEILLVAAPDSPELRVRIAAIMDAYRRRFAQRSVGIVSQPGCAAF